MINIRKIFEYIYVFQLFIKPTKWCRSHPNEFDRERFADQGLGAHGLGGPGAPQRLALL